jgi:hypothetical protein
VFDPAGITFKTGQVYKLVLHNPSKTKHYFTSPGLADRVFTRKVQVMDAGGTNPVSEIKGAIREIEVFPGGTAEWWFVPVAAVASAELTCHVKDEDGKTHAEKAWSGESRSSDGDGTLPSCRRKPVSSVKRSLLLNPGFRLSPE